MSFSADREVSIEALRRALPYLRLYRGKVFVLKASGSLCADPLGLRQLAEQLSVWSELGIRFVLVHGGGPQTSALSRKLGLTPAFVEGRRITCPQTLEVAVMTLNGSINTAVLAACRAAGMRAVGLSGLDGGLIQARRRPPQPRELDGQPTSIDYGMVGDVLGCDTTLLERLWEVGMAPIVSPICADEQGQVLNVNADTVASALACALRAEKLFFLTEAPGLLEDKANPASLVSYTDVRGLGELRERGALDAGMLPKVKAAIEALAGGVRRVHMVGYRGRNSLLMEVFTNEGCGTLIVQDTSELLPAEQAPASFQVPSLPRAAS